MNNSNALIEINDATVYRGNTRVFDGLSLTIEHDCSTAILGPNGAGKTTLLKLLTGELYPLHRDGAYVRIFGQERWNVWELRARLGLVSHDLQHRYAGYASGTEVILSGCYASIGTWDYQEFNTVSQRRAERIMHDLDIYPLRDRRYETMSTGEQRRFLLGRALINEPATLILDEPTSGLDLKTTFQYVELVRQLIRAGRTIILVTHHIHEIPPEIRRVVLLSQGRVVADGGKTSILTDTNLSRLFDTPVHLARANGFYQAMPGTTSDVKGNLLRPRS